MPKKGKDKGCGWEIGKGALILIALIVCIAAEGARIMAENSIVY